MNTSIHTKDTTTCFHCGEDCNDSIHLSEKNFCCDGCKMVYEILNENDLCNYYDISSTPGINAKGKYVGDKYAYLDDEKVKHKLLSFTDGKQSRVTLNLPQVHCSSCIWLLENLFKINKAVISSQVNFPKKEISILYNEKDASLRNIAELLAFIGYEPRINLSDLEEKKDKTYNHQHIFKIGIAGFCFGNIMMFSFPEYFSKGNITTDYQLFFSYAILSLSLPVFFYSSSEFFISAWKGIQQKFINIDAPVALAILVTFVRSVYEIISQTGAGYMDSMTGIVFFMLIGRYFQNKTYDNLSFERDYKSYFPIAVTVLKKEAQVSTPVTNLKVGDRISIRNNELIPADAMLFKGDANIDYSFVTGESIINRKVLGEVIYAGGKHMGSAIELEIVKEVSQSYLTQLWNNDIFKKEASVENSFIHNVGKYFTIGLFALAFGAFLFWAQTDFNRGVNAFTAVLIIACPCALLLAATFTNGNILRIFGNNKFYLKNAEAIEKMKSIDSIVFDKTGTITQNNDSQVSYEGIRLSADQKQWVKTLSSQSTHPLSKSISNYLSDFNDVVVKDYNEYPGKGIEGFIDGVHIKMGSFQFVHGDNVVSEGKHFSSKVFIKIGNLHYGQFTINNKYREGLKELIDSLKDKFNLVILSGDNDSELKNLNELFSNKATLKFNQSPKDKLNFIKTLQENNKKVAMIGDGLNDAGALKQSDIGISISDNINNFSPACDAILDSEKFNKLKMFFDFSRASQHIIVASFIISILYNVIGLGFAIIGELSPVIAAILMPISSISIVLFTTGSSSFIAKTKGM